MNNKITKELEEFAKKNQKQKSVFDKFRTEIIYLRKNAVSLEKIIDYLKTKIKNEKGLTVQNLSQYIKRLKTNAEKFKETKEFFQAVGIENKKISTAGTVDKKEIQKTEPIREEKEFELNIPRKITHTPNTDAAEDLY